MLWWFCKIVTNQDERKCKCIYENLFDNAWSLEPYVCSDSWIALMLILNVLRSYRTAYYCITVVPILYCTVQEKGTNCTVRSTVLMNDSVQSYFTWRLPNICRVELISTVAIIENGHYAADQVYFLWVPFQQIWPRSCGACASKFSL